LNLPIIAITRGIKSTIPTIIIASIGAAVRAPIAAIKKKNIVINPRPVVAWSTTFPKSGIASLGVRNFAVAALPHPKIEINIRLSRKYCSRQKIIF
jgi:hypothetical protein